MHEMPSQLWSQFLNIRRRFAQGKIISICIVLLSYTGKIIDVKIPKMGRQDSSLWGTRVAELTFWKQRSEKGTPLFALGYKTQAISQFLN
jgi:hypothetical protein